MKCSKCKQRTTTCSCTACRVERCTKCMQEHLRNVSHVAHKRNDPAWIKAFGKDASDEI